MLIWETSGTRTDYSEEHSSATRVTDLGQYGNEIFVIMIKKNTATVIPDRMTFVHDFSIQRDFSNVQQNVLACATFYWTVWKILLSISHHISHPKWEGWGEEDDLTYTPSEAKLYKAEHQQVTLEFKWSQNEL